MSWTPIDNHTQQARDRLLEQQKNLPGFQGILDGLVVEIQNIEDMFNAMPVSMAIDTAIGIQLDRIGTIVGVSRVPGQTDEEYRLDIKSKIIQNLNQGTSEEVIAAARFFLGTTFIWYAEIFPAAVDIFTSIPLVPDVALRIRAKLESFLPAGVSLDSFGFFDGDNAKRFNLSPGFGDVYDPSVGGLFADLYNIGTSGSEFILTTEDLEYLLEETGNQLTTG